MVAGFEVGEIGGATGKLPLNCLHPVVKDTSSIPMSPV